MTDKLPPPLLALFQPRPPLRYLPPCDVAPSLRKTPRISGVARYVHMLADYDKDYNPTESWLERRERKREEKRRAQEEVIRKGLAMYHPRQDPNIKGDPYKTLFVSRLSYKVTEQDLMREFGRYGGIERIRVVTSIKNNKPMGYAFIVFERERDMKAAYREMDGVRIKDRRVVVDVERGRTVNGWKPRRLGGGLGGRGYTKEILIRPLGYGDRIGRDKYRGGGSRGSSYKERSGGFHGNPKLSLNEWKGFNDKLKGSKAGIGYKGSDKDSFKSGYQESSSIEQNGSHFPDVPPGTPTGPSGRTSNTSRYRGSENHDLRHINNMNYSSGHDYKESDRYKSDHDYRHEYNGRDDRRRDHDNQSREKERDRSSKRRKY
ncbi:hypothetical protein PNEG_01585 [Pneumocystis murina B123]|uniref:RRM domain-containing protein n=1 Tax=Pneumocystis murina (strain B123) TaxID=1069680 RepID=M7PIQ8_PNEMU|nr:hypothetical protein PNEG_01585 [Pneumocystis murina B123]EMR10329.1 hypothetical protein PNEG_01585 [Pneumocystis murina B123]